MMDNNFFDYSLAMERIKTVTGCKTQQDLAKFLGVSQSCISDAKKRMAIPAEWLLKLLQKQGINPDWIRSGLGAQYLHPSESHSDIRPNSQIKSTSGCMMQDFFFSIVRSAMDGRPMDSKKLV
ncbi:MAG: helix-turn-helix domain-containing protein [Desulfovibrio sp.]|nr:helix-turn-helix domain-containing protein [Desulfovibrio sp.]